jgi:hypothetical protein
MHRVVLVLLLLSALPAIAADAVWPGGGFSEVRAYAWPKDLRTEAVVLDGMTLKADAINPDGAVLTIEQIKALLGAVLGKHPEYPVAACHTPHNAFVFYDEAKKPMAYVEICFKCFNHHIAPKGAARNVDLVALAAIFDAHKLPMGEYRDLAAFRKHFEEVQKMFENSDDEK